MEIFSKWRAYRKDSKEVRKRVKDEEKEFDLYSSLGEDNLHRLCVDIDFPARLIPSRTYGHFHLYFDGMEPINFHRYCDLLDALQSAGILEPGYVRLSKKRGMTMLRAHKDVELPSDNNYLPEKQQIIREKSSYMGAGDGYPF